MKLLLIMLTALMLPCLAAPPHLAVVAAKKGSGGGSGLPETTNLVAWYDFDDSADLGYADAHGSYTLTENGTPAYTTGSLNYMSSTAGNGFYLSNATIDDNWHTTDVDATMAVRFRLGTGWTSTDFVMRMKSGNASYKISTAAASTTVEIGNVILNTGEQLSTGVWYVLVVRYTSGGTVDGWLDNAATSTTGSSGTFANAGGTCEIPRSGDDEVDIDWACFFHERLTDAECGALYNSGATIDYDDL